VARTPGRSRARPAERAATRRARARRIGPTAMARSPTPAAAPVPARAPAERAPAGDGAGERLGPYEARYDVRHGYTTERCILLP